MSNPTIIKILHIVEILDRGAVENWLVRMLLRARKSGVGIDWTFYCALGLPGLLDEKVRAVGARVIHSPVPIGRKASFASALRDELKRGQYDVLHCHHDLVSAVYLLAATGIPIRKRIVHIHNADQNVPTPSPIKQRLFREPMRRVCMTMADCIVGISHHTLDTFLAGRTKRAGRDVVHYYGVDPTSFETSDGDRAEFRLQLGLADDAPILLFAGRLVPEKNPVFVVDVLAAMRRLDPRCVAVFAGMGSLEQTIRDRARELGVENAIRMLGWRSNLPDTMRCCDWFILPRPEYPMEGFGLAVVEAQLAGLRMLLSNGISDAPLLPTAKFCRLALSAGPQLWAEAAMLLQAGPVPSSAAALAALKVSPMDMDVALLGLMKLHQ